MITKITVGTKDVETIDVIEFECWGNDGLRMTAINGKSFEFAAEITKEEAVKLAKAILFAFEND